MNPQTSESSSASCLRGSGRSGDSTSASWRIVSQALTSARVWRSRTVLHSSGRTSTSSTSVSRWRRAAPSRAGSDPTATIDVVDRQRPRTSWPTSAPTRSCTSSGPRGASVERERDPRVGVDLGLEDRGWRRHVEPRETIGARLRAPSVGRLPEHRTGLPVTCATGEPGHRRSRARPDPVPHRRAHGPRASASSAASRLARRHRCSRPDRAVAGPAAGGQIGALARRTELRAASSVATTVPSSPACSSASSWNTRATWPISAVSLPNGEWTRSASSVRAHCRRWTGPRVLPRPRPVHRVGAHPSKSSAAESGTM